MIKVIRQLAVYLLKNYSLILFLYNSFFRLKNKRRFNLAIDNRKEIPIFNYIKLSQPLPFYPIEAVKDSNFYGYVASIKKYSNIKTFKHSIEHGLYLGNYVQYATYLKTTQSIVTFSETRKKHLQQAGIKKPIFTIGPYIHYAAPLINDESFIKIKESIGNTLLFFFSHSIPGFQVKTDVTNLIKEIKDIASGFDTVMICLHFKDIIDDIYPSYFVNSGFRVVTAGHMYDPNFISRLKSIIQLSDYTVSNSVGTHTGYCTFLGKPHYIINHNYNYTNEKGGRPQEYRNEDQRNSLKSEKNEILGVYSRFENEITVAQKNILDKYWGSSLVKSPEELFDLLS